MVLGVPIFKHFRIYCTGSGKMASFHYFGYLLIRHTEHQYWCALTFKGIKTEIVELTNQVYPDEVAQFEPPHPDLHGLSSVLCIHAV